MLQGEPDELLWLGNEGRKTWREEQVEEGGEGERGRGAAM